MSCGVGHRCSLDPALLWLWHRLAATAPIRPIAWEPPYATGVALEKAKNKNKKNLQIIKLFQVYYHLDVYNCMSFWPQVCAASIHQMFYRINEGATGVQVD